MPHRNLTLAIAFSETLPLNGSEEAGDVKMAVSEVVAAYRLHSAQCTKLHNAPETRKSDSRFFLWLNLGSSWRIKP